MVPKIEWVKFGKIEKLAALSGEGILVSGGSWLQIIEATVQSKVSIYTCETGVEVSAAHHCLPCIAYADKRKDPRVFILVYPGFKLIKTLPEIKNTKVLALKFSDLELLIGLTSQVTKTNIYFWNWRTTELLSVIESGIEDSLHNISVSLNFQTRVAQWNENSFHVWQTHSCYKKLFVSQQTVPFYTKVKPPTTCTWNSDGQLYVLDSSVALFTVNLENGVIQHEIDIPKSPRYEDKSLGVCIALHTTGVITYAQGQLCLLRRRPDGWVIAWTCIAPEIIEDLTCLTTHSGKEQIYCLSKENKLMVAKGDKNIELTTIYEFGKLMDMFCIIQPTGQNFIAFTNSKQELTLWETASAKQIEDSCIEHLEELILMVPSPNEPVVVLAFKNGMLRIFHIPSRKHHSIFPTRKSISCIKFSAIGDQFVAASLQIGLFFLVDVEKLSEIKILASLDLNQIVSDFILDTNSGTRLLILTSSDPIINSGGDVISIYTLDAMQEQFIVDKEIKLSLIYRHISGTNSAIFAVPLNSTKVHELNQGFQLKEEIETEHKLPNFIIKTNKSYIFTFGEDGIINGFNIKDGTTTKIISINSHHYADEGVSDIDFDLGASTLLISGRNRNITSYSTGLSYVKTSTKDDIFEFSAPMKLHENETWLESQERIRVEKVQHEYRDVKKSLRNRLGNVKISIKRLLDDNVSCRENEKLCISDFDLDIIGRTRRIDEESLARIKSHETILSEIEAKTDLSNRIIESTWQKLETPSKELKPFINTEKCPTVSSYGLIKKPNENEQEWIRERLKLVDYFHYGDFFQPWIPANETELKSQLKNACQVTLLHRRDRLIQELLQPEEQSSKMSFLSTSAESFLPNRILPHSTLQVHTGFHAQQVISLTEEVIEDLMKWFNIEFNKISSDKKTEMKSLQKRRTRLRHVVSELKLLNYPCELIDNDMIDPVWSPSEVPETILTVSETELKSVTYRSPEEIKERESLAEEEETKRKTLLLDDFRERALEVMMDGVLEKQWQDEIKKSIPKPKFMEKKDVNNWSEDDIRKANIYEDSVARLEAEQDRYKKLLVAEFMQLNALTKESGTKFDEKLKNLHEVKLRVESAICEEQLNILRLRQEMLKKVQMERNEEKIRSAILKEEDKLAMLHEDGGRLQDVMNEGRAAYETLLVRDKNLDKNFKKDFPDYSSAICEQLHKLSKKRPKLQGRISSNAAVLSELGRSAVQNRDKTRRLPLPLDGLEFLKGIDALDAPINIPAIVNEISWETLCRLRRAKIDSELKIRALSIDIAETEQTTVLWQKQIKNCRDGILRKQTELEAILAEKRMNDLDCTVQLVLPQRVVEVPTTGRISDFKHASLIPKSTVDDVNHAIQRVGQEKIRALVKSSEFRKKILCKEWEHRKLVLQVEELKAQKEALEQVHVTKEFQDILNARAKGIFDEKGFTHLENEIRAVRMRFEKSEISHQESIEVYDEKIKVLDQENGKLDEQIVAINKELVEKSMLRDTEAEDVQTKEAKVRMKNILERGKLVSKNQQLETELAQLIAERDALRLKIHPTIVHKN